MLKINNIQFQKPYTKANNVKQSEKPKSHLKPNSLKANQQKENENINDLKNSKKTKSVKDRFKLPNEVEGWVFGYKDNDQDESNHDSELSDIDDTYLQTMAISDKEDEPDPKYTESLEQKNLKISEMIRQIRSYKKLQKQWAKRNSMYSKKESFSDNITNIIFPKSESNTLNSAENLEDKKIKKDQASTISAFTGLSDFQASFKLDKNKTTTKEIKKTEESPVKEKKKNKPSEGIKYKPVSSCIARAMPGSVQQNITLEKTFFKDLLRLSKQRYIAKLNFDYQNRIFIEQQSKKGLYGNDLKASTSSNLDILSSRLFYFEIILKQIFFYYKESVSMHCFMG